MKIRALLRKIRSPRRSTKQLIIAAIIAIFCGLVMDYYPKTGIAAFASFIVALCIFVMFHAVFSRTGEAIAEGLFPERGSR